jgi:hypothetical protein
MHAAKAESRKGQLKIYFKTASENRQMAYNNDEAS